MNILPPFSAAHQEEDLHTGGSGETAVVSLVCLDLSNVLNLDEELCPEASM